MIMVTFYDRYDKNPIKVSHDYNQDGTEDFIFAEVAESLVDENIGAGLQNIVVAKNDSKKRIITMKAATKTTIGGVIVGDGIDVNTGTISLGQDVRDQLSQIEETSTDNLTEAKSYTDQSIEDLKGGVGTAYDTLIEIEQKLNDNDDVTAQIIGVIVKNNDNINKRVDDTVTSFDTKLTTSDDTINKRITDTTNTINTRIDNEVEQITTELDFNVVDLNSKIDALRESTSDNLENVNGDLSGRLDEEVKTLNTTITNQSTTLNTRITNEITLLNTVLTTKTDELDKRIDDNQISINLHKNDKSNPHGTTAAQVGLGNVTNESKLTMFSNPTFTGIVTIPTAIDTDNSTKAASTSYVTSAIKNHKNEIKKRHFTAVSKFNGITGTVIVHNLASTKYAAIVNLLSVPAGSIGDIGFIKTANDITVYNTGAEGADFDITLMVIPE